MKGMVKKFKLKGWPRSWGYKCVRRRFSPPDGRRRQIRRKGFRFERDAQAALRDAIGDTEKNRTVHKDSADILCRITSGEWLDQHGRQPTGVLVTPGGQWPQGNVCDQNVRRRENSGVDGGAD